MPERASKDLEAGSVSFHGAWHFPSLEVKGCSVPDVPGWLSLQVEIETGAVSWGCILTCSHVTLGRLKSPFCLIRSHPALEENSPETPGLTKKYFCWTKFFEFLSQTRETSIPTNAKSGKNAKKSVWMKKEILAKLKHEKEAYRG